MEAIFFLLVVAVICYVVSKRKTPEVTDWGTGLSRPEDQPTKDDLKYYYKPSEDVVKFLRALIYFGKADGQLREDELEVLARLLIQQQPEHTSSDRGYLCSCIRDIKPFSTDQYNSFIKQLDNTSRKAMLTWYNSLSATQKKNHPFEDHLIQDLKNSITA